MTQVRSWSLAIDWLIVLTALVLFLFLEHAIQPFHRMFSLSDETIMFPYTEHERVPVWLLFLYAFVGPATFILSWNLIQKKSSRNTHVALLALSLSTSLTVFITSLIKNGVGRPRPDFIARCDPGPGIGSSKGLVDVSICTTQGTMGLDDGFRSFPSGHSSYSFAGLGFLAIWWAGQVQLFTYPPRPWKAFTTLTPLILAAMIGVTRTEDYRHHWEDVTVGGVLGVLVAYFCYRQYFPALSCRGSGDPIPEVGEGYESTQGMMEA